jgi:hypothetical protein
MIRAFSLAAALACAAVMAQAEPRKHDEIDSEHLFGFVEGADIGEAKEREFVADTSGRLGKGSGRYRSVTTTFEAKYVALDNLRFSSAAAFAYTAISGVPGFEDRSSASPQSVSFGVRYRMLDRERAPFGLTVGVEPRWSFIDGATGALAEKQSAEFVLLADREFVPGRVFGALNVLYEPERTKLRGSSEADRESTLGAGGALTAQIVSGVFLGGETRYLRRYEGLAVNGFAGHALYLGPTLYAKLGGRWWGSLAWNAQVWGAAEGRSGALDLTHFEHHHVKIRFGLSFEP